ncbi:MAG: phosphatidylserine/phosphatidylglycerophosphate/cardiolipin synthase family protein, partial [Elusimicrobiota bacterium]
SEKELETEIIKTQKPPKDIKNLEKQEVNSSNSKLTNFRIELYKKFKDSVISSNLFQKISGALDGTYFPLKFKEWYDNVYKTLDKMLFKRELFSKINDLYRLFFKPEQGNPKEIHDSKITTEDVISSARDFEAVKESIKQNNQYYRDFGYGTSTDTLKQLLDNPGFLYKDEISLRDYIYEKFYAKKQEHPNDTWPTALAGNQPFFRYFTSVPGQDNLKMEKMFVDLINASKKNIRLVNCFFHPTPAIMTALKQAALRGVRIYITLNVSFEGDDDVGIPEQANAKSINEVIKLPNFHLYRWDGTILHAKVYSFDDEAIFIGSTNMNTRTFYYNGENGVFIHDKEFVDNYIKTHYNTYFVPTEKHPFTNTKVSKIEKPVREKGFIIRWLTSLFNRYL